MYCRSGSQAPWLPSDLPWWTHLGMVLNASDDLPGDEVDHADASFHRGAGDKARMGRSRVLRYGEGGRGEVEGLEELERAIGTVDLEGAVDRCRQ